MKQKKNVLNVVQVILGFLMLLTFAFLIWGELCQEPENVSEESTFAVYKEEWVQCLPDGSEVPVRIPGNCEAEYGEWVVIASTLPADLQEMSFCIRSMQQDIRVYVDGQLRKEYSTLDTQLFGTTSTMTYVFFDVYAQDAGKELRIETMSDSFYTGYISDIYVGKMSHITEHLYGMYAPSAIVAAVMLIIGLMVASACIFVRICFKRNVELLHLANVILIASTWLLVESKLRQFFFPNSTIAMMTGFLLIAILPYPFLAYVNRIQKGRYRKAYMVIGIATAGNYVFTCLAQALHIRDFFEIVTSSHVIIVALIILMGLTMIMDTVKGYVREYREVAIGFCLLMIAGICEISLVYVVDTQINGVALCVGLIVLLFTAALKAIRDLFNVEKEKQLAIAASESKAKFLANMSHEIRTPINTVIGMSEMILRENEDKNVEEYAYNIKSASRMLLCLVNDVLDFSKIEAGKLELVESDYSIKNMLNDVVLGIEMRAQQKGLELKVKADEYLPSVLHGDEIRIRQIVTNLMSNAVKYTEKGSVTLTAKGIRTDEGFVLEISVADTGIGIKKEDMDRLYDSFQRLELSKNRYIEGTGLGLNIAKQLVDMMGGTMEADSVYGEGSCFTIRIPQTIVDGRAIGITSLKGNVRVPDTKAERESYLYAPDAVVLAVDDNQMNLKVIEMLLKRSGIQLDFATGGAACLEMTREKKYDLILMDHMMPAPDGVETLHMLRAEEGNPNRDTTVIVLTANAIAGTREQYLEEGFADYLSKPIVPAKLEETLEKYLKR